MIYKKTCVECGAAFETKSAAGKFCSAKCANRCHNNRAAEKRGKRTGPHIVVCRQCGTKFRHTNGNIRYCSAECRTAAERARRKERDSARQRREENHNRDVRATMARLARKSTVAKVNAAGRAQGLSYGQMMARKDGYLDG